MTSTAAESILDSMQRIIPTLESGDIRLSIDERSKVRNALVWAEWDWMKLNVFSHTKALITDINDMIEKSEFNGPERSGLRWAYEIVQGFEKYVRIVFEQLDNDMLRNMSFMWVSDPAGLLSSRLFQEQTWLDIIDTLRSRIDQMRATAASFGTPVTPLSRQDFAALAADIPIAEATLRSWKFELRFDCYTSKALAHLKSSLLADHLRLKRDTLAKEDTRHLQKLPPIWEQRYPTRWTVSQAEVARRLPGVTAAINHYLDSLPRNGRFIRSREQWQRYGVALRAIADIRRALRLRHDWVCTHTVVKMMERRDRAGESDLMLAARKMADHWRTNGRTKCFLDEIKDYLSFSRETWKFSYGLRDELASQERQQDIHMLYTGKRLFRGYQ